MSPVVSLFSVCLGLALTTLCSGIATELVPSNSKILVLIDDINLRSSHSLFIDSLSARGYEVDIKLADDSSIEFSRWGQSLYDSAIILAPSAEKLGSGNYEPVLKFIDSGGNVFIAADSGASNVIRDLATECGVDIEETDGSAVIDHINYAVSDDDVDHTLIVGDQFVKSSVILGEGAQKPVLYRGSCLSVKPTNPLVVSVVSASPSAFCGVPGQPLTTAPSLKGSAISLVAAMQARNGARVVVSGSLELLSNRFFTATVEKSGSKGQAEKSGNQHLADGLVSWLLHERGHIRASNLRHHKVGETSEPGGYRITDNVTFSIQIEEWSGHKWQPFRANDVQLQFFMMSPYVLKTLSHNNEGLYYTTFQVPDAYGVFKFKIEYKRLGYTSLNVDKQIPVRPFRHDEYERFIGSAYPYYTSAFSMMVGFFIFGFAFLYHK